MRAPLLKFMDWKEDKRSVTLSPFGVAGSGGTGVDTGWIVNSLIKLCDTERTRDGSANGFAVKWLLGWKRAEIRRTNKRWLGE